MQRQPFVHERVEDPVGLTPLPDQPGRPQHTQVPRDRRPADREPARDLAGGEFAGAEVLQEPIVQPWGPRDCAFRDPSGNMVRFNQA